MQSVLYTGVQYLHVCFMNFFTTQPLLFLYSPQFLTNKTKAQSRLQYTRDAMMLLYRIGGIKRIDGGSKCHKQKCPTLHCHLRAHTNAGNAVTNHHREVPRLTRRGSGPHPQQQEAGNAANRPEVGASPSQRPGLARPLERGTIAVLRDHRILRGPPRSASLRPCRKPTSWTCARSTNSTNGGGTREPESG